MAVGLHIAMLLIQDQYIHNRNDRRPFRASRPLTLQFAKGGRLYTNFHMTIEPSGATTILRGINYGSRQQPEQATLQLSEDQVHAVAKAVVRNDLPGRLRYYDNSRSYDGPWWSISIQQGDRWKYARYDGDYPRSIRRFDRDLDAILDAAGYKTLTWRPVVREAEILPDN